MSSGGVPEPLLSLRYLLPLAAYLYGSLNWAILLTRRLRGVDIRTLGTRNPGAANVGRSLGLGWGALVYFLDLSKSLLPLALGRLWLFPGSGPRDFLALLATGLAAIVGHRYPLFFAFRGGGAIAASMGVYLFFVPVEFLLSVLLGFAGAMVLRSRVRFPLGQWTPILFVTLTPFLTLAFNRVRLPLGAGVGLGGHPGWVLVGMFAVSLLVLALNWDFLARKLDGRAPI